MIEILEKGQTGGEVLLIFPGQARPSGGQKLVRPISRSQDIVRYASDSACITVRKTGQTACWLACGGAGRA